MEPAYRGVNLSGAEFGETHLPGTHGQDYIYPNAGEVNYFLGAGMNVIRIPIRWERIQHALHGPLDATELGRLRTLVQSITTTPTRWALIDVHNYARYDGVLLGTGAVDAGAFADLWSRLAAAFKTNDGVIFGLMNEPFDISAPRWLAVANAGIAAIRGAGADQLILVPGTNWTGAHSWNASLNGDPPNAQVMHHVVDAGHNFAIEMHQYFDPDSSGNGTSISGDPMVGPKRLASATAWLRQHGLRGFLGEFGFGNDPDSLAAGRNLLQYLRDNGDAWLGWTYWSAGPWWHEYRFTAEPVGGQDRPQMTVMRPFL